MKFSPQHLPLFIFRTRRRRRRRSRRRKNELPVSYGFARPSLYYLWKQRKRYIKAHDNCPCITSANSYNYWHDLLNRHYRTFSLSRVRGYIKVPFFQFRYLNLLISSHGWDVANQLPKPRDFESVRQTNQILTFVSAAGDLMTKLYYIVYQNPPKI